MTADEFEMDWHSSCYRKRGGEWDIKTRDGDMKIEFSVYDEDIQETLKDNFDSFIDTAGKEFANRVLNLWDDSRITDEQKQTFLDVLRMVIG